MNSYTKFAAVASLVILIALLWTSVVHADGPDGTMELKHVDSIEETRGFTNGVGGSKCSGGWGTVGDAVVGDRKCDVAVWYNTGDAIWRDVLYKMPVNGWLKFRLHRNSHNAGWSWTGQFMIKKRNGSVVTRQHNTGLNNGDGRVHLWRGEKLLAMKFVAIKGDVNNPATVRTLKVWSTTLR